MRSKSCLFFLVIFIAGISKIFSQPCTTLGQTPATAFPVCGTTTFVQNTVPLCGGTLLPGPCAFDLVTDINPFWYRFTCFAAGTLGFLITPNNPGDDYDWQLFDITGRNPGEVYIDASLFVACNWSGLSGITGASAAGTTLTNCGGNGFPLMSRMPSIIAGHEYLLLVSHYTPSQSGYQLSFTGGTAVIADPVTPAIASANVDCGGQQVNIIFNKKMRCSSLAGDRTDFVLSPANGTIAANGGFGCLLSFDMDSAYIQFTSPLPPGNYTLSMANGTDGNTLLDNCGTPVPVGNSISFAVPPRPTLPGPTTISINPPSDCAPIKVIVNFADWLQCTSAAPDGSDFVITGPSPVAVTAVIPGCTGMTNGFNLQFTAPITVPGTYTVQIATGSDGNTLVGDCNRQVIAGSTAQFTVNALAPITMGGVTIAQCSPTSLTLTFADPIQCNTIAANGSDFTVTGPSGVTITGAAAVNCNNGETNTITLQFASPILAPGNYQVQALAGSDGNTLLGQCKLVPVGASSPFTINAQSPIAMGTVTPPPCMPQSVTLTFAEPVNCNSIAANGSDFVIAGPSVVTVTSAAATCNANGETTSIIIQLSAPILVTGTYNVQMATGSDGNSLTGNCGRQTTAGELAPFTLVAQPAIAMGTVDLPLCTPQSIALTFADPVRCNSIAANGSDFVITGPSAVTITSASATCNANGETTSITVQFSSRILIPGTYTVQMSTGSDGNTLIGQCNRQVNAGTTASFILAVQPPLPLGTITPLSCSPSSVTINFTESFDCTSISANGSEFIITGPSAVTITAAGAQCNINPNLRTITIQLSAPIIVSGTYQLEVQTGTDGNTIRGDCNRYITVGDFTTFTIPPASPVAMDSLVPVACSPSALKLIFSSPVKCSSIAANGSDFTVTGPTPVAISSARGVCDANGLTTGIDIQLASPVVTGGLYILQLVGGTDGNTLLSDCDRQTPAGVSLSFTPSDTVSAEFQYQIQYDCTTDVITFTHNGQHNVNQWAWTVNGTAAGNLQTFTQNFSAASRNDVQLVISNGVCSDTYSTTIVLNNKVTVDFISPESVCPEDTVTFVERTSGQVDNWQWTFGNGNTSTLQAPLSQIYPLTGTETLYPVTLQVSNNLGCSASATKTVKVLSGCIIAVPTAFTPNNDGKNDYLYPLNALKADNLDFKIFNRWGQLVFHSKDWRQKWDGRINGIQQGTNVYIWTLKFTHRDTKQKYSLKGTSTLVR